MVNRAVIDDDYYQTRSQAAIDRVGRSWQRCREEGHVRHVCSGGVVIFLTADFFDGHHDESHDCGGC